MKGAKLNAVCNSELTGKNTELCRHSGILLTRLCDMLQGMKTACKGKDSMYSVETEKSTWENVLCENNTH